MRDIGIPAFDRYVGIDYSVAAWMRRADLDGTLAGFLDPPLAPAERTMAEVEGWIPGIT